MVPGKGSMKRFHETVEGTNYIDGSRIKFHEMVEGTNYIHGSGKKFQKMVEGTNYKLQLKEMEQGPIKETSYMERYYGFMERLQVVRRVSKDLKTSSQNSVNWIVTWFSPRCPAGLKVSSDISDKIISRLFHLGADMANKFQGVYIYK